MMDNTRRTFLGTVSALGLVSVAGVGAVQEDEEADIELGARVRGWEGARPDEIEGETNPTLELVADEDYVLVWENLDGQGHNFAIETEDGEDLVSSEFATNGTVTVEFTASEEMHEYYCEPHPSSMRGEIEIVEGDGGSESEDGDEVEEFAAAVDELFELTLDEDGWHGESPDEIEDEENPTLSVLPGEAYVISFSNQVGVDDETGGEDDDETGGEGDDQTDGDDDQTDTANNETAGDDEGAADGADNETDGEQPDSGDEVAHEEGSNLVLVDENDEEVVATEMLEAEDRGAVTFVAREEITAYRDDSTGAEGTIEIDEEQADEDGAEGDENDDEGSDAGSGNETDEGGSDAGAGNETDEEG